MHSQLGLMDREGLPFRTYTYRQQTPRDMHTLQRTGHEKFIFYTSEGTLLQNADGMVCHHTLTQGVWEGACFSFFSLFQDSHLVLCQALSNLVASGPVGSLSRLFAPLYPSVESRVQMLETVMPLGPGCRRGSEQCQPYLQRENRVCQECGNHVFHILGTILQTREKDISF